MQTCATEPLGHDATSYLDVRYDERTRPYTSYPVQLTRYLAERYLTAYRGQRLLDLGCGRGEFLHGFARCGFDAVGVDRARPLRSRFHEPVVVADFQRCGLPFAAGSLSVIFSKSVLEHIFDVSSLLQECHRVLQDGGRMITMVPDWRAQWRQFHDDWTHVRPFTLVGLRECIMSHGFRLQQAVRFRQLPWLWRRPYLRPVADLAALLPGPLARGKLARFSREWMLLVVADKPHQGSAASTQLAPAGSRDEQGQDR